MYLRGILILLLVVFTGTSRPLSAQPAPSPAPAPAPSPAPASFDAQLASVLRTSEGISLVGRSGQLYEPAEGDHRWLHKGTGGVSTDVTAMYLSAKGKLFAVGNRAPLFTYQDGVWETFRLARKGSAAANSGTKPIIALRRKIYELSASGWRPIGNAPAVVEHLWAASSKRIVLWDVKGQLWTGHGEAWRLIKIPLAPKQRIATIIGRSGLVVALTTDGALHSIDKRMARPLSAGGVKVQLVAAVNGKLLAIGEVAGTNHLYEITGKTLTLLGTLWPLAQNDRFAILSSVSTGLLIATARGQAQIQSSDGSWKTATIGIQRPTSPPIPFKNVAPARSW